MVSSALRRTTGILLLIEGLLLFAPVFILGAAINWPASLDEPAAVVLPLLVAQANSVQLGYFIYLIYPPGRARISAPTPPAPGLDTGCVL